MGADLKDSEIADVLTDIIKRRPVSTLQAEHGMEELRNLVDALEAEEKRGDLHAKLNRLAAAIVEEHNAYHDEAEVEQAWGALLEFVEAFDVGSPDWFASCPLVEF